MSKSAVYIAGRFNERPRLRELREKVRDLGVIVTSSWLDIPESVDYYPKIQELRKIEADVDIADINDADLLILDLYGDRLSSGRHFEAGYALGVGMGFVTVGPRQHIFDELGEFHFEDWDELLEWLKEWA